ncbi:hypothetical protein PoB_000779400 [Plakobranchus ocellatus]|uniref:G-protein coupled receptors family 1 profile domain-containing protein n=1 Tax=Plakobranchus ocellatus TaxID=259542 RepID=A0AAV3YG64_9GAST|nr:hypothetical protein PoB_000779400 [Plakobranchus ocellatus]
MTASFTKTILQYPRFNLFPLFVDIILFPLIPLALCDVKSPVFRDSSVFSDHELMCFGRNLHHRRSNYSSMYCLAGQVLVCSVSDSQGLRPVTPTMNHRSGDCDLFQQIPVLWCLDASLNPIFVLLRLLWFGWGVVDVIVNIRI